MNPSISRIFRYSKSARRGRKRGNLQQNLRSAPCWVLMAEIVIPSMVSGTTGNARGGLEAVLCRSTKVASKIFIRNTHGEIWWRSLASGYLEPVAKRVPVPGTCAYRVFTYVSSRSSCTCVNGKSSPVYKVLACHALYAMYACATSFSLARLTRVT